jgi:hypothetical protein
VISQPSIGPGGGGNRVRLRNNTPTDTTLIVKAKGNATLDLRFTITGYTPSGAAPITITGANAAANFSNQVVDTNARTVTITDSLTNKGSPGTSLPSWGYTIAVTNSAGLACLIDPGIENEAE